MRKMAVLACAVLALLGVVPQAGAQDAATTATIAKNLAENILGKGQVRSSRVVNDGRRVEIVWESATFKLKNTRDHTRELLRVEAEFAASAIFRVLTDVHEIQFQIVLGKRSLATGSASRARPLLVTYATDLGG
ncbi:MAG: hypothetical protein ACREJ4_16875 [Candidatus Methylomirabilaceae bacterium]